MLTALIIGWLYMWSQLTYQHNSNPTFNTAIATWSVSANDDSFEFCLSSTGLISWYTLDLLTNDTPSNHTGITITWLNINSGAASIISSWKLAKFAPHIIPSNYPFAYTGLYTAYIDSGNYDQSTIQIILTGECYWQWNTCGNGVVDANEWCDDGNTINGDTCTSNCTISDNNTCNMNTPWLTGNKSCASEICDTTETTPLCKAANICGNGKIETYGNIVEQCDLWANNGTGSQCSSTCQIATTQYLRCQSDNTCGYQTSSGWIACNSNSDCWQDQTQISCNDLQLIQTRYTNNGWFTRASIELKDNTTSNIWVGIFDPWHNGIRWKEWDSPIQWTNRSIDGTLPNSYHYTDQTKNYTISILIYNRNNTEEKAKCVFVVDHIENDNGGNNPECGNGTIDNGETCDDNNRSSGDGCSSSCQIEDGYSCQWTPSSCSTVCGDGKKIGNEQCDDDNTKSGDGCSSTCQWERPSCNEIDIYWPTERNDRVYVRLQKDDSDRPLKIKDINRWDGRSENGINTLPESHYYNNRGEYDIEYTILHADNSSLQRDCSETVIIRSLKWCTDTKASNYDPNATEDDGSCRYAGSNTDCWSIQFHSTANNASVDELLFFSRNNHNITSAGFYAGAGNFNNNATSPISYSYNLPGEYTAQLIVTTKAGTSQTCRLSISIGESWCMQPWASNYNPSATRDDGSCVFGGGSSTHCGDRKLQVGEECDDGNTLNGDGCSDTCQIENWYAPYCGNNIIEIGEQCDGDLQCNAQCQIAYNSPSDRYQHELCRIYGICNDGNGNTGDPATTPIIRPPVTLPTPWTLPASGPDEDRAREQFAHKGIEMIESPTINLDNIDRYHTMDESDPLFADPLYRIQNILPAPHRQSDSYIVAPSIGTVTPIQTIQDKQTLTNFVIGDGEWYQDYLNQWAVYYPFTPRPWQQWNTVVFWHSSSYDVPDQQSIGNVFKLLPLLQRGDIYYIVTRTWVDFTIYQYQVHDKKIVNPDHINVIDQNLVGHKSTLMTCYPIGTDQDRYIVEWLPMSTMRNVSYSQLLDVLSMPQEIQLRALAESYRQQYNQIQRKELIQQLQRSRAWLIQQSDLSPAQKQHKDSVRQYLIYHLAQ